VELLKSRVRGYSVVVTREHVEAFEKLLKSKAPKTRGRGYATLEGPLRI
jgi:hypothetical protein